MSAVKSSSVSARTIAILLAVSVIPRGVTSDTEASRAKRSDDGGPLEVLVQQLTQQVNSHSAQLAVVVAKTANLEKTIAFHAWSTRNPVHAAAGAIIVLGHAVTNVGNAYDSLTGVFTAPVSGLYDFQTSILSFNSYVQASICADTVVVGYTLSDSLSDSMHAYYSQSTARVIIHVNAGQKVYLRNPSTVDTNYVDLMTEPYTTFTGVLVKAD